MTRFVAASAAFVIAGLVSVYTEIEAVKIGYEIRKQEEIRVQSLDRQRALKYNIARLKAPDTLEKRLLAQNIKLSAPREWQTLVMPSAGRVAKSAAIQSAAAHRPMFTRFFVGTAQAEAKES